VSLTPNSIITPQTPTRGLVQFLQGTDVAATYKTIYTGGANGSKIVGLWLTTNDGTATHLVTVQIVNTAVKYGGVAITSVLSAGFANATPAQNLMSPTNWPGLPVDAAGNPYLILASGDTLQATFATALTASTLINIVAVAADY
jgi:hypothetical protein